MSWSAWILLSWLLTVAVLLTLPMSSLPWWLLVAAILLRTHLQTGLFILGHDAMHGVLWQRHPVWNHRLGCLALALYAALPYGRCRTNHQRHHQHAGTAFDPDVPSGEEVSILGWYQRFMGHYLSRQQMSCLLLGWSALLLAGVNWLNVLVICTVPLLLSSVQLFVVGPICRTSGNNNPEAKRSQPALHCRHGCHFWLVITSVITGSITSIRACDGLSCPRHGKSHKLSRSAGEAGSVRHNR